MFLSCSFIEYLLNKLAQREHFNSYMFKIILKKSPVIVYIKKMNRESEIFNKEIEVIVSPKKRKARQLTQKQLDNLAKGRAAMAEKRKVEKDKREAEKLKKKDIIDGENLHIEIKQKGTKQKRRTLKEINKSKMEAIYMKLQKEEEQLIKEREGKEEKLDNLKLVCLSKAKSVKEYTEIKNALERVNVDLLMDTQKLKQYAVEVMNPYLSRQEEERSEVIEDNEAE